MSLMSACATGFHIGQLVGDICFVDTAEHALTALCSTGWQIAATRYRDKIRRIFALMFDMREGVLPENRTVVDEYLHKVWVDAAKIFESLQPAKPVLEHLEHKFQNYITFEEERIMKNLDGIKYNVDALDTVLAVAGPGRLENVSMFGYCP